METLRVMEEYLTMFNGGNPFRVLVNSSSVSVYKCFKMGYEHYKDIPFESIFIGYDGTESPYGSLRLLPQKNGKYRGNSILIKVNKCEYVHVGREIYSFHTSDNIVNYYSTVGNNQVPYPIAEGEENIYFMLDRTYIKKDKFSKTTDWEYAYNLYYGHIGGERMEEQSCLMENVNLMLEYR